jgi:hypothetical protein
VALVLAAVCVASLALYARWVVRPYLLVDDFQILLHSWTWQRTWDDLWVPANEHAMPVGRLTTWLLVRLAGQAGAVPYVAGLQGPLAVVLGALLLYLFVRRELGHPFYGLAAAALFAVSSVYQQAVYWFSSTFSILTLDTLLLALLAAQALRRTGSWVYAHLCVLGVALAPTWFASGILAGPLCALYLLPPEPGDGTGLAGRARRWLSRLPVALVPLYGTALFLLVSLPRTAETILHLPHYREKTALGSFHLGPGLVYTVKSVVENLLLGALGIGSVTIPDRLVLVVWLVLLPAGVWWWWRAPAGRRLMVLGLGLIFASYLLVYSARAEWLEDIRMNTPMWSRYHLLPQLGLALFVVGGLPRWAGRWRLAPGAALTPRHAAALLGLVALLAVTQVPRVIQTTVTDWTTDTGERATLAERYKADEELRQEQLQALRRLDVAGALCRQHHIGAATAEEALGWEDIPGGGRSPENRINLWEFLHGSPDPDPSITPDEAKRLLAPVAEPEES